MNRIFISGNLTKDPEIMMTYTNKAVVRTGIAVKRIYSKENEVDFFNLVAWGKTAEFMNKWLNKGSRVLVEGRLQTSSYTAKDGTKRTAYDIVIENIEFAGGKSEKAAESVADEFEGEPTNEEDVPF